MTIQKWKDAAEFVALVAVVGTLIALVVELRQTQDALRAQTYQDRAFDAINTHLEQAKNPHLTAVFRDTFDRNNLSPEEYTVALNILFVYMIDKDNEHFQYQSGFLDEEYYKKDTVRGIAMLAPIWRDFGLIESREEFRTEVERILSEHAEK